MCFKGQYQESEQTTHRKEETANPTFDAKLVYRINGELSQFNKKITQFLKWAKIWTNISPKKTYKWAINIYIKDAQQHQLSEKCKSKPQSKQQIVTSAGKDVEKQEPSYTDGGNVT